MYSCQKLACCLLPKLNTIKILQDNQYKRETELFKPACKILFHLLAVSLRSLCSMGMLEKIQLRSFFVVLIWLLLVKHCSAEAQAWSVWPDLYSLFAKSVFVPLSVCHDTGSCSRISLVFEKQCGLCGCRSADSVKYVILFLKAK